jgi:hypothetical protein
MSAKYWREPLRWNRKGRARVFSGSMCDVFEAHPEPEVREMQDAARDRLWELIEETPDLTWMLLTKRPGNIAGMAPATGFPRNVWLGTSVEDQTRADERIPQLLAVPAAVHFLSCEPLLGPVDLNGPADQDGHRPRLTYWLTGRPEWGSTETTATGLQLSSLETGATWHRRAGYELECLGFVVPEGQEVPEGLSANREREWLIPKRGRKGDQWRADLDLLSQRPKLGPVLDAYDIEPIILRVDLGRYFHLGLHDTPDGYFLTWGVEHPPNPHLTPVPLSVYYSAVERATDNEVVTAYA